MIVNAIAAFAGNATKSGAAPTYCQSDDSDHRPVPVDLTCFRLDSEVSGGDPQ